MHTPRMGEDGYIPPEDLGLVEAGPAQVRPISTTQVKSLIETRYRCWKTAGQGDSRRAVPALFPQQSATSACESARLGEYSSHLKVLHGVTHTPTIRPDGTILDVPGYDAATMLLYLPDLDLAIPPIPDNPTAEQVKAAVELILEPVAEFPFVSENDRATWIGLAFTPILRPLLPGPYQLGVITATNPGSGKTKLAKMITNMHGGVLRSEMPREADELRKSITAALVDHTAPVVGFDNLRGVDPVLRAGRSPHRQRPGLIAGSDKTGRSPSPTTGCGWSPATMRHSEATWPGASPPWPSTHQRPTGYLTHRLQDREPGRLDGGAPGRDAGRIPHHRPRLGRRRTAR